MNILLLIGLLYNFAGVIILAKAFNIDIKTRDGLTKDGVVTINYNKDLVMLKIGWIYVVAGYLIQILSLFF